MFHQKEIFSAFRTGVFALLGGALISPACLVAQTVSDGGANSGALAGLRSLSDFPSIPADPSVGINGTRVGQNP